MPITLQPVTIAQIVRLALLGKDHRVIVTALIDELFVAHVLEFFKKIVNAKIDSEMITSDWYEREFMTQDLSSREIAWNSGTNLKTIKNSRGSEKKDIVLDEAYDHHRKFVELVNAFDNGEVGVTLGISFRGVNVELDLSESFVVINALAVRRAGIRGGAWSTAGKQVEGPLMQVLCAIHDVDPSCYRQKTIDDKPIREVDFYLVASDGHEAKCEVKLMGRGNPESADTFFARDSELFVASTLSDTNKNQLDANEVHWTELQRPNGFVRFSKALSAFGIPHRHLHPDADHTDLIQQAVDEYLSPFQ